MKAGLALAAALMLCIHAGAQTNSYTVKNIVTNVQDSRLVNPWGLSRPLNSHLAENEWWVSDQVTGLSTLYDVDGTTVGLAVTIPPATGSGLGSPTGTAFQRTANRFAFATLDGTISVWDSVSPPATPGANCAECHTTTATIMVNHSSTGASYQGLTIAPNPTNGALAYYAANANGGVEAYDAQSFSPIAFAQGAFTDSQIPLTYTPAGIQAFGSTVFVTYNAIAGGGTGYVDAYNNAGKLLLRLERGFFNQPWGVALAPSNFGKFSNMILVGNTGNGLIGAYKLDGIFQGFLKESGNALALPGLWGLEFGDGNAQSGPTNVLYFTAGGSNLTTGVFGAILANSSGAKPQAGLAGCCSPGGLFATVRANKWPNASEGVALRQCSARPRRASNSRPLRRRKTFGKADGEALPWPASAVEEPGREAVPRCGAEFHPEDGSRRDAPRCRGRMAGECWAPGWHVSSSS